MEGTIKSLFEGSTRSFIKCINVEYESSRSDIFLDLNVRGPEDRVGLGLA